MQKTPNKLIVALFAILSFVGFLDATYLAAKHYLGSPVTCSFLKGCEVVTSSQYAVMFGVSIALFGALYYLTLLILTIVYFDTKNTKVLMLAGYMTFFGFLFSLYFVYLQVFIIQALCFYCLLSALSSTLLFILGVLMVRDLRKLSVVQ